MGLKTEPLDLVINFKKNVYETAINELMPLLDLNESKKYKMPKILIIYSSTDGQNREFVKE